VFAGALVGGAYLLTDSTPDSAVAMSSAAPRQEPTIALATPSMALAKPAAALTAPLVAPEVNPPTPAVTVAAPEPKLPEIVYASREPDDLVNNDWAWQAWTRSPRVGELDLGHPPKAPESKLPVDAATVQSPAPKPAPEVAKAVIAPPPAKTTAPVAVAEAPVEPYQINVSAARVIHMYTREEGDPACWYELKLDRPQVDLLKLTAMGYGEKSHAEVSEFDHLDTAAPAAPVTLAWWRPAELTDATQLSVMDQNRCQWWIAVSQRTGRMFLYANKPVNFGPN